LQGTREITLNLIAVKNSELALGEPLQWAIYDQHHKLLKARGESIDTEAQLLSLFEAGPMRELNLQSDAKPQAGPVDDTPEIDPSGASATRFTFHDMNLKVGDRMQIAPPPKLGAERYIVRLIGYIDRVGLLITPPRHNGLSVLLRRDDDVVARIFSRQNAFGFTCTITRVCKLPFEYLHLSFPGEIQGAVIRKSARIKIDIIASVADPDNPGGDALPAKIQNISSSGALVDARKPLGEKGQKLQMTFRVKLHNMDVLLTTSAVIRSVFRDDETDETAQPSVLHHGIEFCDLQPNDNMILQSLIYQQMIEKPHTVI
jgi:hypothetical protein